MGTCKVLHVCWSLLAAFLLLNPVSVHGKGPLTIVFRETPANITSRTSATFRFDVVGANGVDPCSGQKCVIQCKLDRGVSQDCPSRQDSFTNLQNGGHIFNAFVNTSIGVSTTADFHWTVDTISPTAVVDAGQAYTNAVNVTVNITFSKACNNGGGFVCTGTNSCDLLVYGAGVVIPSTLKETERGLRYSVVVGLSTQVLSGRVTAVLAKRTCADAAGNFFQRTETSRFVIRFDRRVPTVNLWTAIPDTQVLVGDQPRTLQTTNRVSDLRIYLDFSQPTTSGAQDLLGLLNVSSGNLTTTQRKSSGNRRYGYLLSSIANSSVVTVTLPGNLVQNRYGTLVAETSSTSFLYDIERPQVQLSTTSSAKTKSHVVPVVVQFTEPVFMFTSSNVIVSGGTLASFNEVSKNTYALEVYAVDNNLVTVSVPANQTADIAGNLNLASPILQVRHYTTPAVSVALYSLTTAGLLTTALVSGAVSISSATLAAAGALSTRKMGSIGADPSRNLLGMASHLQVLALSDWLAVSLPIQYQEITRGLRWLIPHVNTPWQDSHASSSDTAFGSNVVTNLPTILQVLKRGRRGLLSVESLPGLELVHSRRKLGANTTLYGPAFGASDYELYFVNQSSYMEVLKSAVNRNKYTGWQDFERNMFWLGVVGGGLVLLHILTLLFLRWRTRTSLRGALSVPRFELFLFILALPCMCQASAFIIRGGTLVGIVIGVLLLSIPAAFLVSVTILLLYGIFLGALVQYKEFRREVRRNGVLQPQRNRGPITFLAGTALPGKWVRKGGLSSTFLPRYGLIFEDRKGPPKMVIVDTVRKWPSNNSNGIDKSRANIHSDDENEEVPVSSFHKALGGARASYILIDLSRKIILGVVFGAYAQSGQSWSQVGIVLGITSLQLVYLVVIKPFRSRGVQIAETISLLCETGVFSVAMVLLAEGNPTGSQLGLGIVMLVFLLVSFMAQLINQWYALMKQLLMLSTTPEPSLKHGLKMLACGFILPIIPRNTWSRFITPQLPPQDGGIVSSVATNPPPAIDEREGEGVATSHLGSPLAKPTYDATVPLYHPGSPAFIDPRSIVQAKGNDDGSGPPSGEIRPEASQRSERQSWSQWNKQRSLEGKRSKGSSKESKTEELKMLRELAKASFPRRRKDFEYGAEQGTGTGSVTPMEISSPVASPRGRERRYARRRRQFPGVNSRAGDSYTDDSLSEATSDGEMPHEDPPMLPETSNFGDPATMATSSSRSYNKGSGHSESHSTNLPLREPGAAIRPLEER